MKKKHFSHRKTVLATSNICIKPTEVHCVRTDCWVETGSCDDKSRWNRWIMSQTVKHCSVWQKWCPCYFFVFIALGQLRLSSLGFVTVYRSLSQTPTPHFCSHSHLYLHTFSACHLPSLTSCCTSSPLPNHSPSTFSIFLSLNETWHITAYATMKRLVSATAALKSYKNNISQYTSITVNIVSMTKDENARHWQLMQMKT